MRMGLDGLIAFFMVKTDWVPGTRSYWELVFLSDRLQY